MPTYRTFIALPVPSTIKEEISKIQENLSQTYPEIRWIKPENIHLTVAFLGNRTRAEIQKIDQIIKDLATQTTPLVLRPHYIKSFGYVIAINVLSKKIRNFYENLVQAFKEEGIVYRDKHRFKPHITIGRVRRRPIKRIKGKATFPPFRVDQIVLLKSTLLPEGAKYETIARYSVS